MLLAKYMRLYARHVLEELLQRPLGVGSDIVKLIYEPICRFGADGGSLDGRGFVLEEVTVVCSRELQFDVWLTRRKVSIRSLDRGSLNVSTIECLALGQILVMAWGEQASLVSLAIDASESPFTATREKFH